MTEEYINHIIKVKIKDKVCKYVIIYDNEEVYEEEFIYNRLLGETLVYNSLINNAKKKIDQMCRIADSLCDINIK